ncbi:capsule export inner-membrane protein CtrB [Neisseria zoodegmatis]|uniref:Capsule export inner-membrane protein CtrB n=1 Tax=Neisseria zoodegmatis TaxID=326523 RepID=A0A378X838_9NEIS|nr:capsule biosynthesis protein [Neisseria zoodegmatis]SUA48955.1 capsule export inner-membrane protein CtrB [Neisseria zoodegmatis]
MLEQEKTDLPQNGQSETVKSAALQPPAKAESKPKKKKRWLKKKFGKLFWATVIVPTVCATVYFSVWASDRYVSESSFVVRAPHNQASVSGLGALLQGAGFSRSQDDTYTVREYMGSRSALDELGKTISVRTYYEGKGDIFSRFNGFGLWGEKEAFYQYFKDKVKIDFDPISGISVLNVESFDAKESQQINAALLSKGEELINKLNTRARKDTIEQAQHNVTTAEERVKKAAEEIAVYRIENGIFDLKSQSEAQMGLVSKLQDELIVIQTQLDQVKAITPENPQISGLQAREKSLKREIQQQMQTILGGSDTSITAKAAAYQRLFLENELAEKQLAAAIVSLENAKAEAERKQLYLEIVSQPSRPDMAERPHRLYNIMATFFIGLILYGIISLLAASVREHKN